jgi:hypothetical protein
VKRAALEVKDNKTHELMSEGIGAEMRDILAGRVS